MEAQAVCLYCEFSSSNAEKLRLHMHELHDFDLNDVKLRLNLSYYQQVKLVNYIRRQVGWLHSISVSFEQIFLGTNYTRYSQV